MSLDKLDAAKKYYEGLAAEAEVTIDMYLNNSVGIGEHPGVMEELRKQITTLQNRNKAEKKQLNG